MKPTKIYAKLHIFFFLMKKRRNCQTLSIENPSFKVAYVANLEMKKV